MMLPPFLVMPDRFPGEALESKRSQLEMLP